MKRVALILPVVMLTGWISFGQVMTVLDSAFVGSVNQPAASGGGVDNTLVLHYKFNEGSGTTIADETGTYAATGTANTWATGASGSGSSIVFNGTTAWAKTDGNVTYGTNILSFSFWIYDSEWYTGTIVFEQTASVNSANSGVVFDWDFTDSLVYHDSGGYRLGDIATQETVKWYHVVLQVDASTSPPNFTIHIDGSEVSVSESSISSPGATAFQASVLYFASRAGVSDWNGFRLDDFRIYKGLLSEGEIDSLYANPE